MSDNDAESDTESYFLTPVNEYNIVDKIQSANNQLFGSIDEDHAMESQKQQTQVSTNKVDERLLQSKHRVTFSSDIEEYEDDISEEGTIEYKDDEAIEKEIAEIIERDDKQAVEHDKIDGMMRRISIEEAYSNDDASVSEENDYVTELEVVEEINDTIDGETVNQTNQLQSNVQIETKNIVTETIKVPKIMLNDGFSGEKSACGACNKTNNASAIGKTIKRPTTSHISTAIKRTNCSQSHRIASANTSRCSTNRNMNNNHDDLLKIHLNVRACCENKYLDNNRLPRYNGYISQYGLSKDQLELRELNRQKYLEKRARREREIMKAKQEIADLNEQAFRQWLIRKNHVSRPKYKNMYDEVIEKPRIKYHPSQKFHKSDGKRS